MASPETMTSSGGQGDIVTEVEKMEKKSDEVDQANVGDRLKCECEDASTNEIDSKTGPETSSPLSRGMSDTLKRLRGSLHRPHLRRPRWGSVRGQKPHGKLEEDDPVDVANEAAADAASAPAVNAFDFELESSGDFFRRPMRQRVASQISGFFRRMFSCNDVRASSSEMNLAGTRHIPSDAVALTFVSNEHAVLPPSSGEGDAAVDSSDTKDGGESPEKKPPPPSPAEQEQQQQQQ